MIFPIECKVQRGSEFITLIPLLIFLLECKVQRWWEFITLRPLLIFPIECKVQRGGELITLWQFVMWILFVGEQGGCREHVIIKYYGTIYEEWLEFNKHVLDHYDDGKYSVIVAVPLCQRNWRVNGGFSSADREGWDDGLVVNGLVLLEKHMCICANNCIYILESLEAGRKIFLTK